MKRFFSFARRRPILASLIVLTLYLATPGQPFPWIATVAAQTVPTNTTLSAAITATAEFITVASATDMVADSRLFVGLELMTVVSVNGTTIRVRRAVGNSSGAAHQSGELVWVARPEQISANGPFRTYTKYGPCTAANETFLPQINVATGEIQTCYPQTLTAGVIATANWGSIDDYAPVAYGVPVTIVSNANYVSSSIADASIIYGTLTANRTLVIATGSIPGRTVEVINNCNCPLLVNIVGLIAGSTSYSVATNSALRLVWTAGGWFTR